VVKNRTEKVTIDDKGNKTFVEIKNGKIYVDGNMVSSIKSLKNEDHKIVINHKTQNKETEHDAWEEKEKKEDRGGDGSVTLITTDKPFSHTPPEQTNHNAMLGVYTNPAAPANGAFITGVIRNSPAENAGLMKDDIITKIDGKAINGTDDLIATVGTYSAGDNIIVTYNRRGYTDIMSIRLGNKEDFQQQIQQDQQATSTQVYRYNLDNRNMDNNNDDQGNTHNYNYNYNYNYRNNDGGYHNHSRRMRKPVQLDISASDGRKPRGVYLDSVKAGSPAEAAGLQKGDDITRINGERIKYAYEMQEMLSRPGIGDVITIEYRHNKEKKKTEVHVTRNNDDGND